MVFPARVLFALSVVDPRPGDRILEVGSGPGVAAELVCARLTTGHMIALDRSTVSAERTARRCAEHVAAGRLELRTGPLDALDVPDGELDTAFAVNVNLFWTRPAARELGLLRRALRPGGTLRVCYGDGPGSDRVAAPVAEALRAAGFSEVAARFGDGGFAVSGRA